MVTLFHSHQRTRKEVRVDLDEGKGGNDMSFKITGPGFYRKRDGGKAEVFAERGGMWFGLFIDDDLRFPESWTRDGRVGNISEDPLDIVAVWNDPPPIPPDGFQLMPRDMKPWIGCQRWALGDWKPIRDSSYTEFSAEEWDTRSRCAPLFFASPIPKPESEKWVATNELRWRKLPPGISAHGDVYVFIDESVDDGLTMMVRRPCVLEQKWTCGDKHEWRPVPVEVQP